MGRRGRLVIAERWAVLRRGLIGVLSSTHVVVLDVEEPSMLAPALAREAADLVIVGDAADLELPTLVSVLRSPAVGVPVLVLCEELDGRTLREVLRAGALGVLSKKVDDAALLDAVDRVLRGERVVDQRFLPLLFGDEVTPAARTSDGVLTARELDVLALAARGASNREIAATLVVGESTVKTHLGRIYTKLEVSGRHRAVGRALELGLLSSSAQHR